MLRQASKNQKMPRLIDINVVIYALGNVAVRADLCLLIPRYTRTLTIEDYRRLATAPALIQLLVLAMYLGTRAALVRFTEEADRIDAIGTVRAGVVGANAVVRRSFPPLLARTVPAVLNTRGAV